jgi:hypothetical protein
LSTTQKNFEATTKSDTYVGFWWYLPDSNVAPVPGTDYFMYSENSVASSPAAGPVLDQTNDVNLTATLGVPPASQRGVDRVLKNGVIYVVNETSRKTWSYSGADVVLTTMATDGVTAALVGEYDDWSAPIALTGSIASASALDSFLGFMQLNEPLNFDFTQSWLPGASYFTRKGFQKVDAFFVWDWTTRTYDANVSPYPGPETTLEGMFANPAFADGLVVEGVHYFIGSGSISTIEGVRAWVATQPRPASDDPTTSYIAYFEFHGRIYSATLRRAGTRFRTVDGVDSTIVDDYTVHVNSRAAQSIRQAVRF